MAISASWLLVFREVYFTAAWFNSNFNLLSTTLKFIQLPFLPNPFFAVTVNIGLLPTLLIIASNSSAPDFLYTFVDVQNSEVGRNERSVVNSLCKDQGSCTVI